MWKSCSVLAVMGLWTSLAAQAADPPSSAPAVGEPVPLNPQRTVLVDLKDKRLLLKCRVVLREGLLEMLICKAQTKEHESILSVDSDAYLIHAGLLMLGAKPGSPASFDTQFHPPTGQEIDIYFNWTDAEGRPQRANARTWVRHVTRRFYEHPLAKVPSGVPIGKETDLRYDTQNKVLIWYGPMTAEQRDALLKRSPNQEYQAAIKSFYEDSQSREIDAKWVFAGSGFAEYEDGRQAYLAESGDIVCVANFGDALLDVTVESSTSNEGLLFEPYTERIPELGTEVTVELVPVQEGHGT